VTRSIQSILFIALASCALLIASSCSRPKESPGLHATHTFAGLHREFGEPFGLAFGPDGLLYVSDGEKGKIFRVARDGASSVFASDFDTPSAIGFDAYGNLFVADSGKNVIFKVDASGAATVFAGVEGRRGYADGESMSALFNGPIGLAVWGGKIYVADTYNDKIRIIADGRVSTLAGSQQGYQDGTGSVARFDTPFGIAARADGSVLVADTGNRRLRLVMPDGRVSTLAGGKDGAARDGTYFQSRFELPTAVSLAGNGSIFVSDGNSVRVLGRGIFPIVETLSGEGRGYSDGPLEKSNYNRPSGITVDAAGNVFIADSENEVVRVISGQEMGTDITPAGKLELEIKPEGFRALQPARWPYDPPLRARDIAGTLGEVRGTIGPDKQAWFHNGLDVAGAYGETARFVRSEKVLRPDAVQNFDGLRELIRMPELGYIHIRLGRDSGGNPFQDSRFQFSRGAGGALTSVRVARGTKFAAGDAIGTLNRMNHVHLIAGRVGSEMNALDALGLPGLRDSIKPTIEEVKFFDRNWNLLSDNRAAAAPTRLQGLVRVVVRAFDRMDGGAANRKLGLYRLGYRLVRKDARDDLNTRWTISFARMPDEGAVNFVYAPGSESGYSPVTKFDYIVTNKVDGKNYAEDFLDAGSLEKGRYILTVEAADFYGNVAEKSVEFKTGQ
jgi:sugar lactone lactonase YvrE